MGRISLTRETETWKEWGRVDKHIIVFYSCAPTGASQSWALLSSQSTHSASWVKDNWLVFLPDHCDGNPSEQQQPWSAWARNSSKAMKFPGHPASLSNSTIPGPSLALLRPETVAWSTFFIAVASQSDDLFPTTHNVVPATQHSLRPSPQKHSLASQQLQDSNQPQPTWTDGTLPHCPGVIAFHTVLLQQCCSRSLLP